MKTCFIYISMFISYQECTGLHLNFQTTPYSEPWCKTVLNIFLKHINKTVLK